MAIANANLSGDGGHRRQPYRRISPWYSALDTGYAGAYGVIIPASTTMRA